MDRALDSKKSLCHLKFLMKILKNYELKYSICHFSFNNVIFCQVLTSYLRIIQIAQLNTTNALGDTIRDPMETNYGALLHSSMLLTEDTTQYHGGRQIKGVRPSPYSSVPNS